MPVLFISAPAVEVWNQVIPWNLIQGLKVMYDCIAGFAARSLAHIILNDVVTLNVELLLIHVWSYLFVSIPLWIYRDKIKSEYSGSHRYRYIVHAIPLREKPAVAGSTSLLDWSVVKQKYKYYPN